MTQASSLTDSTPSLLNLLSNPVIFDSIIPYLTLQSILRLSAVARSWQDFIFHTPKVFRHLDLSKCQGAYIRPSMTPIDSGGNSWRAQRMDENLSEDEFYSGPLRGVISKLRQKKVLSDVQVLILDELASVTNDIVMEIVNEPEYNVKILSIRKCVNINQSKLQQFLRYICRPGRAVNSPKLQGLYVFTDPTPSRTIANNNVASTGVTMSDGALLGVLPVDKSRCEAVDISSWYAPSGRIVQQGTVTRSTWEETLQVCKGIIVFDVVLCSSMHEAMAHCLHDGSQDILSSKPGVPTIATVALGSEGCSGCGQAPSGTPVWGQNNVFDFPLLSPPPQSGRLIDAVRPPMSAMSEPRLIVSCTWCLANRHCDSCHRWWCGDCYNPKKSKKLSDLESLSDAGLGYLPSRQELSSGTGDSVKVFNGLCVENCLVGEMMSGAGSYGMWA